MMRALDIKTNSDKKGIAKLKASFRKNWKHYLQEAFGLAIFMISACFFGGMLESNSSSWHHALPDSFLRIIIMGLMMGITALFIFYSPLTASSGAHINPAVTITFFRLKKMEIIDTFFYIIFQLLGGTLAVYLMAVLLGKILIEAPVNYVATVPGKYGTGLAAITEFAIAFVMMAMILFTSANDRFEKYTRIFSGCLVCSYVIIAGPISGFGMNPARSFASAFPSHIYTAFWIYILMPFAGMLSASEFFLFIQKRNAP